MHTQSIAGEITIDILASCTATVYYIAEITIGMAAVPACRETKVLVAGSQGTCLTSVESGICKESAKHQQKWLAHEHGLKDKPGFPAL
jgi:hypothetical protein